MGVATPRRDFKRMQHRGLWRHVDIRHVGVPDRFAIAETADRLAVFETGIRYQMYHALALLAVAWAVTRWPGMPIRSAGWLFIGGTVVFSGSLYVLALSGVRWVGAITPIGGLMFLAGWVALAAGLVKGP